MKRRLIAVGVLATISLLGVPSLAIAVTGTGQVSHVTNAMAGPPYCC